MSEISNPKSTHAPSPETELSEYSRLAGVAFAARNLIDMIKAKPDFYMPWRCPYMEALDKAVENARNILRTLTIPERK